MNCKKNTAILRQTKCMLEIEMLQKLITDDVQLKLTFCTVRED